MCASRFLEYLVVVLLHRAYDCVYVCKYLFAFCVYLRETTMRMHVTVDVWLIDS